MYIYAFSSGFEVFVVFLQNWNMHVAFLESLEEVWKKNSCKEVEM